MQRPEPFLELTPEVDIEFTFVTPDVGTGELHCPAAVVVVDALEGEDPAVGVHIQQPGLRRVQPGDGEALLPPGHTDAVKA